MNNGLFILILSMQLFSCAQAMNEDKENTPKKLMIRTLEDLEKIEDAGDDQEIDLSEFDSSQIAPEYMEMVRFLVGTIESTRKAMIKIDHKS